MNAAICQGQETPEPSPRARGGCLEMVLHHALGFCTNSNPKVSQMAQDLRYLYSKIALPTNLVVSPTLVASLITSLGQTLELQLTTTCCTYGVFKSPTDVRWSSAEAACRTHRAVCALTLERRADPLACKACERPQTFRSAKEAWCHESSEWCNRCKPGPRHTALHAT